MLHTELDSQFLSREAFDVNLARGSSSGLLDTSNSDGGGMATPVSSEEELRESKFAPIAIVGMAMRLPGGVKTEGDFWDLLLNKNDGLCRVPENRYNVNGFYHDSKSHFVKTKHGYFLQDDPAHFDTKFFGLSSWEAGRLDPQQRLLLEVVWECMEGAGQVKWRGKEIGCYVGVFGEDWLDLKSKDTQSVDRAHVLGTGNFALSNRISYEFDLTGPSMTLQTGCSSSLVGLHQACAALQAQDCSSAIVAGTNLILTPTMTTTMSDNMVLAPDGICKTFDAAADGYGRGEAINAIYIKPLETAIRDGDPIRAVIRSTATNCDGKTASITTPGSATQKTLIQKAYETAGISNITETPFFECHGTGTAVGDTAEVSVVSELFGNHRTFIGSVKPNIGHGEGASGISSVIKSVLALENGIIPPNIHFNQPNPNIPFKDAQLVVPVEQTPWPAGRKERVSVNCFGIGGANAHVILDSAASFVSDLQHEQNMAKKDAPQPIILSGATPAALHRRIEDIKTYFNGCAASTQDLAYTLAIRREMLQHRGFLVGRTDRLVDVPMSQHFQPTLKNPRLHFVFTGQGAQWTGMGRELLEIYEGFLSDIRLMDDVLQKLPDPPQWTIERELSVVGDASRINEAELSQPLCTALQIGIVNLLSRWGVKPVAVVGHSSGEIAAAYAAGAITLDTAIIIAFYRGVVAKRSRPGAMAAVAMSSEEVKGYLTENAVLACENSPQSVTVSGDPDEIDLVIKRICDTRPDTFCRRLKINVAYHSDHMGEIGQMYQDAVIPYVHVSKNMIPLHSSVTGKTVIDPSELNSFYWRRNLESPVLFSTAVTTILQTTEDATVFLEIGPHSALSGPIGQIVAAGKRDNSVYLSTIVRGESAADRLVASVAAMVCLGLPMDLSTLIGAGKVITDLPSYPWDHEERHWCETRATERWRLKSFPNHELLGSRLFGSSDLEPTWRNILSTQDVPWLLDHKLFRDIVFPGAGYIAMAGEAIRQMTESEDYTVENVYFKSPLFLHDTRETEIITSLKPVKLTEMVDSEFFEFTISAHDGEQFVKHCQGQVRAGCEVLLKPAEIKPLTRHVSHLSWYNFMDKLGLRYGPRFQGLRQITADPVHQIATGIVENDVWLHESQYSLHPTIIDESLQLLGVAACNGLSRRVTKLCIPSYFDRIYISKVTLEEWSKTSSKIAIQATTRESSGSMLSGNSVGMENGDIVLSLQGGVFFALDDHQEAVEIPLGTHLEWRPDVDLLPTQDMLTRSPVTENSHILIQMSIICLLHTEEEIRGLRAGTPHLQKYQDWLSQTANDVRNGHYSALPVAQGWASLNQAERRETFDQLKDVLIAESNHMPPIPRMLERVMNHSVDIIQNKVSPIELLMEDSGLKDLYDAASKKVGWELLFPHLCHSNSRMRVLEIGAGTGGTTAVALDLLKDPSDLQTFSSYTFTDLSHGFLKAAEDRFKSVRNITYKILDISKDPLEQGFEPASFDLIIAANVLHAVPVIHEALLHVNKLLIPGGRLLMQELCPDFPHFDYVMGILPGWWIGENDDRLYCPYVHPKRWDVELRKSGFSGTEAVSYDAEIPYRQGANIISRKPTEDTSPRTVTIVYKETRDQWSYSLEQYLVNLKFSVVWLRLGDGVPNIGDIICLLDLEGPFLDGIPGESFEKFKRFLTECTHSRVFWVTPMVQTECADPRYALILGLSRTLRKELIPQFATVEIDSFTPESIPGFVQVLLKSRERASNGLNPELEYSLTKGTANVSRFKWVALSEHTICPIEQDTPKKVSMRSIHVLDTIEWVPLNEPALDMGAVEIEIAYTGLNFRDIMIAMGLFGEVESFGLEASGVIRRTGPGVQSFEVGDNVVLIGEGLMRTRTVVPAQHCLKIPSWMPLEDAATMPIVFATAIYSLICLGGIKRGQSVLIHSACGGVGLASIQVCQQIGAKVFVTVGSEEKICFLQREFQIPRNRIFDSHSTDFLTRLMEETDGRGVDVVLNSLAGKLLHASWKCVAPFGKMLELGKRDFLGHGKLDMATFGSNRAFFGVDLATMRSQAPRIFQSLIEDLRKWFHDGRAKPIRPVTIFDACEVTNAFRFMQQGAHMGKILVKMPESSKELPARASKKSFSLFSNKSYLLVGGLGGLGRCISNWMVENGARHLIYLSRSGGLTNDNKRFVQELEQQGCQVLVLAGDVCNLADVKHAASRSQWPIGGVIHLSMVLQDQGFVNMTHEEWKSSIDPKVTGAWNLHQVFEKSVLDFFVLLSSICGLCGNAGQANYAAANTFLDALVQYRRRQGLPASVLDLGIMGDVGFVSEDPKLRDRLASSSITMLQEKDLMDGLEVAIQSQGMSQSGDKQKTSGVLAIGLCYTKPISHPSVIPTWGDDVRFRGYENHEIKVENGNLDQGDELRIFFAEVERSPDILDYPETEIRIMRALAKTIYTYKGQGGEMTDEELAGIVIDSLISIEIRNWFRRKMSLEVTLTDIARAVDVGALSKLTVARLKAKYQQTDGTSEVAAPS